MDLLIKCMENNPDLAKHPSPSQGQEPRATNIFLGNISLADMIIGIATLFILICPYQFHNEISCNLCIGLVGTATMASVFSIGLIAIDRYLYILYGLHYHRYFTTKYPHWMILLVWFLGMMFGCVPIFIWKYPMNGEICFYLDLLPPKIFIIPVSVAMVPMILIMVLYSIILKNALNSRSHTFSSFQNHEADLRIFRGREQIITSNCADEESRVRSYGLSCCKRKTLEITPSLNDENKWKAVKIVAYTTGAYFITWFPYFVTSICLAFCDMNLNVEHCEYLINLLSGPLSLFCLTNSLFNPLIYAWWHPGFKISVKKMYSSLLEKICQKQPMTEKF
ncbi:glucose-dependent insulinotropic receptor-like [Episyrphus balteatus]|uniref:glucose-dependent insulinotropic receptor-like n=1 Tax=Episyrphus balteatus TaxID=286459 RepID=UPI002486854B|nr:glucose-dependent insulinotropic receptor-like [Episyrphus balteatus]